MEMGADAVRIDFFHNGTDFEQIGLREPYECSSWESLRRRQGDVTLPHIKRSFEKTPFSLERKMIEDRLIDGVWYRKTIIWNIGD